VIHRPTLSSRYLNILKHPVLPGPRGPYTYTLAALPPATETPVQAGFVTYAFNHGERQCPNTSEITL
jgi:hypothetical protein